MRLLHTGDLHLDSAFSSLGVIDSEKQRESGRILLKRIFKLAEERKCQLILISGDLFDSEFVTPETGELLCDLVRRSDIPVVISPGNHDPYTGNSFYAKVQNTLGDKLLMFTSKELQVFELEELNLSIFGYAFTSKSYRERPLAVDPAEYRCTEGNIKIFCGHGDTSAAISDYAPISTGELEKMGFAYSALGHIHNPKESEDGERGRVRYCGFAEGRDFGELGDGGVWIVDVDDDECRCERVCVSKRLFLECELNVGGGEDETFVSDISRYISELGLPEDRSLNLRLLLKGNARSRSRAELSLAGKQVCDITGVEYIEIIDETLPIPDGGYLENDTTLRGAFYRELKPKLLSDDENERRVAYKALRIGLAAIEGRNLSGIIE